jgi:hypothetical protein
LNTALKVLIERKPAATATLPIVASGGDLQSRSFARMMRVSGSDHWWWYQFPERLTVFDESTSPTTERRWLG